MSTIITRVLRVALVVPLLAAGALAVSAHHAGATINPDDTDRPKINAGDYKFGNKGLFDVLDGGVTNWDVTAPLDRNPCPDVTPWISGILYLNNLAWQSTRVEVDYHDAAHSELHTWDSKTYQPTDNKSYSYTISVTPLWGSADLDHIIIKIQAFENGSWNTVGSDLEYRPTCHPSNL
jgi:hypothetical protein